MKTEKIEKAQISAVSRAADGGGGFRTDHNSMSRTKIRESQNAHLKRSESEREQVEGALIKSLQQWETTFNATSDSTMLVDNEFKVIQANTATANLLDRPLGQILGKTCHCLLHGTDAPPKECPLTKAKQTKKHQESELYIPSRDIWITVSADPIFNDEGNIIRFVHIVRNITERKKSEQVLRKLNKDLDQTVKGIACSNQELRSFAHVIAHDLKSPLRGIGALADWLLRKYRDRFDEQGKKRVNLLMRRVKRLSELIDSILRYSEIGHVLEKKDDVDLSTLLAEIICEINLPTNIEFSIENKLPTLKRERFRLKQIFQNLLSNAVKYIDKPKGKISIGCTEENGFWKFSVADNGPGINEAYFGKIFEIFQTLVPRDQVESTGVGLTVVKKIVELYGGKIWLTSEPDEGTTFFFTMPKQESED